MAIAFLLDNQVAAVNLTQNPLYEFAQQDATPAAAPAAPTPAP